MTIASPEELWQGYDPEALPLEIEVIRSWQEDGCSLQALRFTGEIADGIKVRVFAIQGAPEHGGHLPGILHVHGGGQTASLAWVKFWARRGYVCVSHDFCGPWEKRTEFTDWGPVTHANMAHANGGYQVRPTPRASSWYHWALVSRRALTLLAHHPSVDPTRMGIFGISVGGTLNWMIAASDPRVKTAVPIYGCGYNVDRRKTAWGLPEPSEEMWLYKQSLSPEAHAPAITCPLLFLDATNDFHGAMDNAYEALAAARGRVRQAFTPRYNHHIEPEQGINLERWMEWHLKGGKAFPRSPEIRLCLSAEGISQAIVTADNVSQVRKVDVYYALGNRIPQSRFWRRAAVVRHRVYWQAALPVMDAWEDVFAFANVTYQSKVCLSTNLSHVIPGQIGRAKATLRWTALIDNGSAGFENWYYVPAYTDPNVSTTFFRTGQESPTVRYFTLNPEIFGASINFNIASHIIGDPQFAGQDGMSLSFDCKGGFDESGLTVSLLEREWTSLAKTYTVHVPRDDLFPGWKTITLPLSRFASEDGKRPGHWKDLERLQLRGVTSKQEPPCFTHFRWIGEAHGGA